MILYLKMLIEIGAFIKTPKNSAAILADFIG
jgi:hypothetical protein